MLQPITITFYFDFLCPFVYRAAQWIDQVQTQLQSGLVVDWKYFSLEQVNTPPSSDWKIWDQSDNYADYQGNEPKRRGLFAFWGAEAARQQGADAFNRFRRVLFHARHQDRQDIGQRATIEAVAAEVELDMPRFSADFADRRLLEVLRSNHQEAQALYQVFGVPTLALDDDNAIYLKLMAVPPADDALALLHELHHSITARRWLAEIKRPNP